MATGVQVVDPRHVQIHVEQDITAVLGAEKHALLVHGLLLQQLQL